MDTIQHGIKDLEQAARSVKDDGKRDIVRCNNCWHYFYDESGDRDHGLVLLTDTNEGVAADKYDLFDGNHEDEEESCLFKGCPVCRTDNYLTFIEIASMSETEIRDLQNDLIKTHRPKS